MTLQELRETVARLESAHAALCDDLRRAKERLTAWNARVLTQKDQCPVHAAEQRVAAAMREVAHLEFASEQKRRDYCAYLERHRGHQGNSSP